MKLIKKIGLIGAGNMGEAFAGAIIKSKLTESSMIFVNDISRQRLDLMNKNYGVSIINDNSQLFQICDIIILAVKPQQIDQVLSKIAGADDYSLETRKIVISIAAGIRIKKIEDLLYSPLDNDSRKNLPLIRVMPNTPALVLAGISGMSANTYASPNDIKTARTILEAMGEVIQFDEKYLDAVTALSGSGPAYVFYFIESMIQGGIEAGLGHADASGLTIATLKGAIKLLEEQKESPDILRQKVTSPGGTTEAALKILEKNKVKQRIIDAIIAASERSRELSG